MLCPICLCASANPTSPDWRLVPMCGHWFHAACIGRWETAHETCPLCRGPLLRDMRTLRFFLWAYQDVLDKLSETEYPDTYQKYLHKKRSIERQIDDAIKGNLPAALHE